MNANSTGAGGIGLRLSLLTLAAATGVLLSSTASAQTPLTMQWASQVGDATVGDWAYGVALDGLGGVYIAGFTHGDLAGGAHDIGMKLETDGFR